jgi:hypothetical protein
MQQTTQTGTQQTTGTPADAGPYDYDLPVMHGGGPPSHLPRPARYQWSWKTVGAFILLNIAAHALHDWSSLTELQSFVVVGLFATVFGYWVGERPKQSFLSWTLKVVGIWLNCYVGFVTVPVSLRGLISEPLAFGLPAFFVTLIFYWITPLKHKNKALRLWQWLLYAAGVAAFWGWMGPTLVK